MKATIVACVILEHDGKYLLVQQARSRRQAGKWGPPGGKPEHEKAENFEAAARREAYEEIGRQVNLTGFLGLVRSGHKETPNLFVCFAAKLQNEADATRLKFKEGEISTGRWFNLEEINAKTLPLRSEPLLTIYQRHRAGLVYPLDLIQYENIDN